MVPLVVAGLLLSARADVVIGLERTGCLGRCPVYSVTIDRDGHVVYRGSRDVRVDGRQERTIPRAAVDTLVQEFAQAGFFEMKNRYTEMVTDLPTTFVRLTSGGRTKRIEDYYGAPEALKALEARVDEVAGTRRWVYVDPETIRELQAAGRRLPRGEERKQLWLAALRGDIEVVRALLSAGADPNCPTDRGRPLFVSQTTDIVAALVYAGADVNIKATSGRPVIVSMAGSGETGAVERLLRAGARVNDIDKEGFTALMRANSAATIELLLKAGADPTLRNKSGATALSLAELRLREAEELDMPAPAAGFPRPPRVDERRRIVELLRDAVARR